MSKGVNRVIIIGRLGKDPEVRAMPNGNQVANITVATSESWKDKQTGQQQDRVEWHRVIFFNKLAEIVGQYLQKGSKIYVEGSLRTNKWQDQSGNDRYTTEIVASNMQMLDSKGAQQQPQPMQQPQQQQYQAPAQQQQQPVNQGNPPQDFNNFDDQIPF